MQPSTILFSKNRKSVLHDTGRYYQCASISKVFCAIAIMQLVEKQVLDLDTNVNSYLHSWKLEDSNGTSTENVTIAHLLSHTGALSVQGFSGYSPNAAVPSLLEILNGSGHANNSKVYCIGTPGKQFKYSGGGTTVLQQIIEDVTGSTYEDYILQHVIKAIPGCQGTFVTPETDAIACGSIGNEVLPNCYNLYPELAAAGLWMRPESLGLFLSELLDIASGKDGIIKAETFKNTCQPLFPARNNNYIGLGIFISNDKRFFFHTGWNLGYRSLLVGSIDGKDGCIAMVNNDSGMKAIQDILSFTPFATFVASLS